MFLFDKSQYFELMIPSDLGSVRPFMKKDTNIQLITNAKDAIKVHTQAHQDTVQ